MVSPTVKVSCCFKLFVESYRSQIYKNILIPISLLITIKRSWASTRASHFKTRFNFACASLVKLSKGSRVGRLRAPFLFRISSRYERMSKMNIGCAYNIVINV